MPFPLTTRVIYERNPLALVICQLRFPPILKIDAELPHLFQDELRARYPTFRTARQADLFPEQIRHVLVAAGMPIPGAVSYELVSADALWTVTLTRESIAVSTTKYERWERFRDDHLRPVVGALTTHYAPAFFTRIGLRYRDVIKRSTLGLEADDWPTLLQGPIAGELAAPELHGKITYDVHDFAVDLEGAGHVRVQHGLHKEGNEPEQLYFIDADFFTEERTEVQNALDTLKDFNGRAGNLFRWCIKPRLHNAMVPRAI